MTCCLVNSREISNSPALKLSRGMNPYKETNLDYKSFINHHQIKSSGLVILELWEVVLT